MSAAPAVECRGIVKHFGPVRANDGVDLAIRRGEVHGIIGENGAGKSTLMGVLYGDLRPDAGDIRVGGRAVRLRSPRDALAAGIGMVHQHFVLVDDFTVLENLLLGREDSPLLRRAAARARAELARLGRKFDMPLDPDARAGNLPVGLRQRLEILKALTGGADILILDEPTAALSPQESERLFAMLRRFAADGRSVLLVTHKLNEILAVTDRVSVMRAGRVVATRETAASDAETLAELMIGRRLTPPQRLPAALGAAVLEAERLATTARDGGCALRGLDFAVRAGELVGIAGVAGNGQSELMAALVGLIPVTGSLRIAGCEAASLGVGARRALGLGHIAEDRLGSGLIGELAVAENAILGDQRSAPYARGWRSAPAAIDAAARRHIATYDVRPGDPKLPAAALSGGNQQKLVCAREMERRPVCLVVGQPTRGVDIAAGDFIHRRLSALKRAGTAIVLVSADLDELRALADRILVMEGGRIVGALSPAASDAAFGLMMGGAGGPPFSRSAGRAGG